jgi:small subunit ribosomal protein S4e
MKKHLKTLTIPVAWPIKRKGSKFTVRPMPGKAFATAMPVALILRDVLKYCKTMKEVKAVLRDNEVKVDGVRRKEERYTVGFMDVFELPDEHYRIMIDPLGKLYLEKISAQEAKHKTCKVIGKKTINGGKTQINLSDGTNLLVKEDKFKVGCSVVLSLPDKKITKMIALENGSHVFMTKGSHVGQKGTVDHIEGNKIFIKTSKEVFETPKESVYLVSA